MTNEFKVLPRWIISLFLWIGLLAGIAIRSLVFLNRIDAELTTWVWRFAMICFTAFFGYRFVITRRRRGIVANHQLIETVQNLTEIEPIKQQAILYILRSILRSKELFNYAFICLLSLLALILDLIF